MADYSSVLARAIAGKNTYEERRVVYDRARNALVSQLRMLDPPLAEADITRQRLALEESIRKVEAEANGGMAEVEPQAAPPPPPPPPPPARPVAPPPVAPAPPQPPAFAPAGPAPQPAQAAQPSPLGESVRQAEALGQAAQSAARSARGQLEGDKPTKPAPPPAREPAPADAGGDRALARVRALPATEPEVAPVNRRPLIFAVVALGVLLGIGGIVFALWPTPDGGGTRVVDTGTTQPPKAEDRVAPDGSTPPAPAPGARPAAPTPPGATVAQSAFLIEENADSPRGSDSFRGTVTWRIDTEAGQQGPERMVRGLVEIPERGLKMLLTIRRNQDQTLPASHTVELLFDTAPDFVHGSVENVAGLRMKPSEQANGLPLVGASARITAGYFLIGLSALGPDRERNVVLLRDRPWIDLPLLYRNGRRAVLAIEKGVPGERVFQDAFQGWGG